MNEKNILKALDINIFVSLSNKKKFCKPFIWNDIISPETKKKFESIEIKYDNSVAVNLYYKNKYNLSDTALIYRNEEISYEKMFVKSYLYAKSLKKMEYKKGDKITVCFSNVPEFIYLFLAINFIGCKMEVINYDDEKNIEFVLKNTNRVFISSDLYKKVNSKPNLEIIQFCPNDNNFENNFIEKGLDYKEKVIEDCCLDDICTILYTDSTKLHEQTNRSYTVVPNTLPTLNKSKVLANNPTYSYINLANIISNTLYYNNIVILESNIKKEFLLYSILINKPNVVFIPVDYWIYLAKKLEERIIKIELPYLIAPTIIGSCSSKKENYLNYIAQKYKFGKNNQYFPSEPIPFSFTNGNIECGYIFFILYKKIQEKMDIHTKNLEFNYSKFSEIKIINNSLLVNSPFGSSNIDTVEYNSHKWYNYGENYCKTKNNKIVYTPPKEYDMKEIFLSQLKEEIELNNDVLSCILIKSNENYIYHIEYTNIRNSEDIIRQAIKKISINLSKDDTNNIYFRIRDIYEQIPMNCYGKLDVNILEEEGISKSISYNDIIGYQLIKN